MRARVARMAIHYPMDSVPPVRTSIPTVKLVTPTNALLASTGIAFSMELVWTVVKCFRHPAITAINMDASAVRTHTANPAVLVIGLSAFLISSTVTDPTALVAR